MTEHVCTLIYRLVLSSGLSSPYGAALKTRVMKKRMKMKKRKRRGRERRERERERDHRCSCLGVKGLYGRERTKGEKRREMTWRVMRSLAVPTKRYVSMCVCVYRVWSMCVVVQNRLTIHSSVSHNYIFFSHLQRRRGDRRRLPRKLRRSSCIW